MNTYVEVDVPTARYLAEPNLHADVETKVLYGERLALLDTVDGFYKVKSHFYSTPGFVYVGETCKSPVHGHSPAQTHRVSVPLAPVYEQPNFKKPHIREYLLPLNSLITVNKFVTTPEGEMAYVSGLGWLFVDQLYTVDKWHQDYVALARMLTGPLSPYVWALDDCSWVIQQILRACGILIQRNAVEQANDLGVLVDMQDPGFRLRRGDFCFWTEIDGKSRHVALMVNESECLHSSIAPPRHMIIEKLSAVCKQQLLDGNGSMNVVRRLPSYRF